MNKRMEWSKLFCGLIAGGFGIYGVWCGTKYYQLAEMAAISGGTPPDATLAVACVSMIMASLLSYLLYQMGLKNSRNKYGVDANGNPYKTMPTNDEIAAEEAAIEEQTERNNPAPGENYSIPGYFGIYEEKVIQNEDGATAIEDEDEPVG